MCTIVSPIEIKDKDKNIVINKAFSPSQCSTSHERVIKLDAVQKSNKLTTTRLDSAVSLLTIDQHLVGLRYLAELSVGLVQVVGVLVRMPFER